MEPLRVNRRNQPSDCNKFGESQLMHVFKKVSHAGRSSGPRLSRKLQGAA
jgi:hypothetical protein